MTFAPPPSPPLLNDGGASCDGVRTPCSLPSLPLPPPTLLSGCGTLCDGGWTPWWLPSPPPPPPPVLRGSWWASGGDRRIAGPRPYLTYPPPPPLLLDGDGASCGDGWTLYLKPSPPPPMQLVCWSWGSMLRRLDFVPASFAAATAAAAGLRVVGLRAATDGLRARRLLCCCDLATQSDSESGSSLFSVDETSNF